MSLLSNKWYYENTAGIILTKKGEEHILSQINHEDVCLQCKSRLFILTMQDGTSIACTKDNYHKTGFDIERGNCTKPPILIRL
jgi:hypothetical protein